MDKGKLGKDNSWGYGVIDVKKLIGDSPESKPAPDIPHPYPEPEEPDTPEEDAERWRKVLIKVGVVVAIAIASISLSKCNKENSEINWDEKFEKEERIIND